MGGKLLCFFQKCTKSRLDWRRNQTPSGMRYPIQSEEQINKIRKNRAHSGLKYPNTHIIIVPLKSYIWFLAAPAPAPAPPPAPGLAAGWWLSNKSSRYALGARLCGATLRFNELLLACIVNPPPATLGRRAPISPPRLGGKLGEPGGLGPTERAREYPCPGCTRLENELLFSLRWDMPGPAPGAEAPAA